MNDELIPQPNFIEVPENPSNIIKEGSDSVLPRGGFRSPNFSAGNAGWKIDSNGNVEFNDGTFRGTFNIGGTTITIDNTEDIQTNLNIISTEGGGTLFLQPGTYLLTAPVLIPSGVTLAGVARDEVIIDCNLAYSIYAEGSNVYDSGSITVVRGSTAVVGAGTVWTAAMVGRSILLGKNGDLNWYEITAVGSSTSLTIGSIYAGFSDLAGIYYTIATTIINARVAKITIKNSTNAGIKFLYTMECVIDDVYISGCGQGLMIRQSVYPLIKARCQGNEENANFYEVSGFKIDFSSFDDSTAGVGVIMESCGNATFFDSTIAGNFGHGLELYGCSLIAFIALDINSNGERGVEMALNVNDCQFIATSTNNNILDGYRLAASSNRNVISACTISNNGNYGIRIVDSTSNTTQVISPAMVNNTSGHILDGGTNTAVFTGNDVKTDGRILLPTTTNSTRGVIYKGASRFIHNFALSGTTGQNTFVGVGAGNFTMTGSTGGQGSFNTGQGVSSLASNTTGYRNTAHGYQTLASNTTGYQNTAQGYNSLVSNTTGVNNTAHGHQSLILNTTGYQNTAQGQNALANNTTGYLNTAQGALALEENTTGYENTANGAATLEANTTGYQNYAGGGGALQLNTTGYQNTANGSGTLYSNTTGYQNTASGMMSLYNLRPTSGAITGITDYSGTVAGTVRVTSAGHGLPGGATASIGIYGTANYDGVYTVTHIDVNSFYFTDAFVVDETTGWWGKDLEGRTNTAVGTAAGELVVTGSNNVFLGFTAGRYELGSKAFYVNSLLQTSTANDKSYSLLYGKFADSAGSTTNQALKINGSLVVGAMNYAADAGTNDTYVITLPLIPTALSTGMIVVFKANTINTGAASLAVNSLPATTIVKRLNTTLANGDILAGMMCMVVYDGTNFILMNPVVN